MPKDELMSKNCLTKEGYGPEETSDLEEEKDMHSSREDRKCIGPEARTHKEMGGKEKLAQNRERPSYWHPSRYPADS